MSDGNILKMWLRGDVTVGLESGYDWWQDSTGQNNIAVGPTGSSSSLAVAGTPTFTPESVTVSGAVVSNPGGYELPVNGTYVRNGSENGKPRFEKSSGNGGELRLFWAGAWFIYYANQVLNENAILYAQNSVVSPPSGSFNSAVNSPSVTGGTYSGTVTVTWSPAHASFDGTQYLTIPNPLTGTSAELFAVVKPDNVSPNGPVIGNIGSASDPDVFYLTGTVVGGAFSLFRAQRTPVRTEAPSSVFLDWHLFNLSSHSSQDPTPSNYRTAFNGAYWNNYYQLWSRETYEQDGPFIGRSTQGGSDTYFQGKIAEILLYNRALTVAERAVVQTYLNNKYSLWT